MNLLKLFSQLFLCLICIESFSQTSLFDQQMQVGFDEKQGQFADLDIKLINEDGRYCSFKGYNR